MSKKIAIFVAIGANLADPNIGTPIQACEAALRALERRGIHIAAHSSWYRSAPVPPSDQPDYVNGAARVETALEPRALLDQLHEIERDFGRVRLRRNEARVIDLDLLAYGDCVIDDPDGLILPHPRLAQRAFVLLPLRDIAPDWRHPVTGLGVDAMIQALPAGWDVTPLAS